MAAILSPLHRAFITGAGGFIGAHLVSALAGMGVQASCLTRRADRPLAEGDTVEGDLLDGPRLTTLLASQRYDAVFHLAGLNGAASAASLYEANVVGTASLLRAVRDVNRPDMRVILVGSSAEYGASPDDPITEESPVLPVGDYGISKLACTRMGALLHLTAGQDTVMVRPFNIIGPGPAFHLLHGQVAQQIAAIEAGRQSPQVRVRPLDSYRDFVDARDVAAGLIAVARRGQAGEIYNLCSERAVQTGEVVKRLLAMADMPIDLQIESSSIQRAVDVPYQRGSAEKVRRTTGWSPAIDLEKSLTDTLNYWRKP